MSRGSRDDYAPEMVGFSGVLLTRFRPAIRDEFVREVRVVVYCSYYSRVGVELENLGRTTWER